MPAKRVAIIINPSKFDDLDAAKRRIDEATASHGWERPTWFTTSPDDGGVQAAQDASAGQPDLVCVMGGDGTVRAVAAALRGGTDVPLGLLPSGTGNLLARNLGVPLDDDAAALAVALHGSNRRIDLGVMSTDDAEHVFLVAAGVGLDAEIMHTTDDQLKKRIGWLAYVAAGLRAAFQPGFSTRIDLDGDRSLRQRARMLLACNCSSLMGGIEIAPGATVDDGTLDLVTIRPTGVVGWLAVLGQIVRRRRGGLVQQHQATAITVAMSRPIQAEVDGDAIGKVTTARFELEPAALIVRIPHD